MPLRIIEVLALGDWQEPNQNEGIFMGPSDVVPYVSDREVDRMVFVLAGCDRSCRFVGPEDSGDKYRPMRVGVSSDKVLFVTGSVVGKVALLAKCYERIAPRPSPQP